MRAIDYWQLFAYFVVLLLLAKPLGVFIARVYQGERTRLDSIFKPVERFFYRICGVNPNEEMGWKRYMVAVLLFNFLGFAALFLILFCQAALPFNPQKFTGVHFALAFNTAASFVTNTNWQSYGGETTMSYFSQMTGLAVQNFLSAASGMAVLAALIRGLVRRTSTTIGNFWVDMTRTVLYVLLPLSLVLSVILLWQGVPQSFSSYKTTSLVEAIPDSTGKVFTTEQTIPLGPVASQISIKHLGTNGGGFFNSNSAHPFESPTPFTNFLEVLALLLIPVSLCFTYGKMVGDTRQGNAILWAMTILFTVLMAFAVFQETRGNPKITKLGIDQTASSSAPGGNMEGKEVRFGVMNSAFFATATTGTSCGAVDSMHDSFTPLGGMVPLIMLQLGCIVYGGVGAGLYGMLIFVIVTVFITGLMVGRTPEYLGKKIESFEMKMASIVLLIPIAVILGGTAIAVLIASARAAVANPGAHGFSEILYAFCSCANNNGSAFAGLGADTPFYNAALGISMLLGRFLVKIPVLAIAGSMVIKKSVPQGPGTFPTHGWLFVFVLISVVVIVGALSFFPALALGPIVEHLQLWQ